MSEWHTRVSKLYVNLLQEYIHMLGLKPTRGIKSAVADFKKNSEFLPKKSLWKFDETLLRQWLRPSEKNGQKSCGF